VHLVDFTIRIYHEARSPESQILVLSISIICFKGVLLLLLLVVTVCNVTYILRLQYIGHEMLFP